MPVIIFFALSPIYVKGASDEATRIQTREPTPRNTPPVSTKPGEAAAASGVNAAGGAGNALSPYQGNISSMAKPGANASLNAATGQAMTANGVLDWMYANNQLSTKDYLAAKAAQMAALPSLNLGAPASANAEPGPSNNSRPAQKPATNLADLNSPDLISQPAEVVPSFNTLSPNSLSSVGTSNPASIPSTIPSKAESVPNNSATTNYEIVDIGGVKAKVLIPQSSKSDLGKTGTESRKPANQQEQQGLWAKLDEMKSPPADGSSGQVPLQNKPPAFGQTKAISHSRSPTSAKTENDSSNGGQITLLGESKEMRVDTLPNTSPVTIVKHSLEEGLKKVQAELGDLSQVVSGHETTTRHLFGWLLLIITALGGMLSLKYGEIRRAIAAIQQVQGQVNAKKTLEIPKSSTATPQAQNILNAMGRPDLRVEDDKITQSLAFIEKTKKYAIVVERLGQILCMAPIAVGSVVSLKRLNGKRLPNVEVKPNGELSPTDKPEKIGVHVKGVYQDYFKNRLPPLAEPEQKSARRQQSRQT